MADFDKLGALDEQQGQEASEEAQEKFRERVAAAQTALKQLKKDESKKKKQDNHLAKIISYFLQTAGNTTLANLIAALVEINTPSDFILAILALVDTQSQLAIDLKKEQLLLEGKKVALPALIPTEQTLENLTPETKTKIDLWLEQIYLIGREETERIMETTLNQDLEINANLLQLAAYLLQKFLQKQNLELELEYTPIYEFTTLALQKIYEKLQVEFVEKMEWQGQKKLI